jgi:nitronate monooxygenase
MSWTDTAFTRRLGLRYPIVQGPFGGGLSAVDLAVAVSEGGGLGSFGVHHLDGAGIREVAAGIRARTARPFNLNLWIPFEGSDDLHADDATFRHWLEPLRACFDELGVALPEPPARYAPAFAEQVDAVLEARPAVFSFVYGIPPADVLARCRELDIVTLGAATTPAEARSLAAAGVDAIVATGFEAGGHRVSFLRQAEQVLTGGLALVPQVADAVSVPVVAAGGIADGRGVAAALTLGAQAVQIGTGFLACRESGTHDAHRQALLGPAAEDTGLTRAFSGRLARGIRNRFMDDIGAGPVAPYPAQGWLSGRLRAAAIAQGRIDLMSLWCGQSAPLLRQAGAGAIPAAADYLQRLVAETRQALSQFGPSSG